MSGVRDALQRRVIPRAIVAASTVRWPGRARAAVRRALGGRGTVELYVAYDDPYSAVAVLGLQRRLAGRRAQLLVRPVVERGIPGDPAVDLKRTYAMQDARRLLRREGEELTRTQPLAADDTAFLARWTAAIGDPAARAAFCEAAMRRLWLFEADGPVDPAPYADLHRTHVGTDPPAEGAATAPVERRMRRRGRGPYDTPAAIVSRQWFFAHERLAAIEHRLDELGWTTI